jgi:DNA-binding transcriptional regulator YdaS (Cro superfamily)
MNAISKAIDEFGLKGLAARCGVTHQAVLKWKNGKVPAERAVQIEAVTEGSISRSELRPDLWPPKGRAA